MSSEDALMQKTTDLISGIKTLAPQATQLAIDTTQASGIASIVVGLIFLAVAGVSCLWGWRLMRRDNEACLVLFLLAILAMTPVLILLADPWNWIAAGQPKLALTHELMQRLLR